MPKARHQLIRQFTPSPEGSGTVGEDSQKKRTDSDEVVEFKPVKALHELGRALHAAHAVADGVEARGPDRNAADVGRTDSTHP